jgi:chromosome segregation ATPase
MVRGVVTIAVMRNQPCPIIVMEARTGGAVGAGWTALLVAVVGVVGTLGASLLTQSRADRTKRMEMEAAAEQRREERDHAEALLEADRARNRAEESIALRRACYITLNTAARQYLTAQVDFMHALRNGTGIEAALEQLEARRTTLRESYAEAQMIVPQQVMAVAGAASRRLNAGYGRLKQIAASTSYDQEDLNTFEASVEQSWALLSQMRQRMRSDLGVDTEPSGT